MEPRRRNPLRRYPTAVCISVWHFGLTQSKTRALNSPDQGPCSYDMKTCSRVRPMFFEGFQNSWIFPKGLPSPKSSTNCTECALHFSALPVTSRI